MGRNTDDNAERWNPPLELARDTDERIEVPLDLLCSTSREQRKHVIVGPEPQPQASAGTIRGVNESIEQRMADKRGVDAVLAKERFLEWKNHRGLRDSLRQTSETARSRCPYLRRDVV